MIDLDLYKSMVEKAKDITELNLNIHNSISEVADKYGLDGYFDYPDCANDVITLLELITNDRGHTLSWWCFEKDFGENKSLKMFDDDNEIPSESIEDVYNYVIGNSDTVCCAECKYFDGDCKCLHPNLDGVELIVCNPNEDTCKWVESRHSKSETLEKICKMIASGEIPKDVYDKYLSDALIGFMTADDVYGTVINELSGKGD